MYVCSSSSLVNLSWRVKLKVEIQVRQCLIYDAPKNPAKLIGVEYMITKKLYETLDTEERKLWHSHDYEASTIQTYLSTLKKDPPTST